MYFILEGMCKCYIEIKEYDENNNIKAINYKVLGVLN
jgi:hypothetical protein